MLELYSDYLLSSFSYTTATGVRLKAFGVEPPQANAQPEGLAALTDGAVSHDQVTRFLHFVQDSVLRQAQDSVLASDDAGQHALAAGQTVGAQSSMVAGC